MSPDFDCFYFILECHCRGRWRHEFLYGHPRYERLEDAARDMENLSIALNRRYRVVRIDRSIVSCHG